MSVKKFQVRSEEEGLCGSWHSGVVVDCRKKGLRFIKFDHLLVDDQSTKLVEAVKVNPILDGINSSNINWSQYRGHIRPTLPSLELHKFALPFGLCVDAYYNEAWWEGVVFDHEDGSEERKIFFPDLGDELTLNIDCLRITQDWNELNNKWKRRGTWLFLELVEEYEQQGFLPVSIKQLWYDIRNKNGFQTKIKEWTFTMRDSWEELLKEVIDDNFRNMAKGLSDILMPEIQAELESAQPDGNVNMDTEAELADFAVDNGSAEKNVSETAQPGGEINMDFEAGLLDFQFCVDGLLADYGSAKDFKLLSESAQPGGDVSMDSDADFDFRLKAVEKLLSSDTEVDHGSAQKNLSESGPPGFDVIQEPQEAGAAVLFENPLYSETVTDHGAILENGCDLAVVPTAAIAERGVDQLISVSNNDVPCLNLSVVLTGPNEAPCELPPAGPASPLKLDDKINGEPKSSTRVGARNWEPFDSNEQPEPKFNPNIVDYYFTRKSQKSKSSCKKLKRNLLKHLCYLGWKFEISKTNGTTKKRFISPDGKKTFYTLFRLCIHLKESDTGVIAPAPQGDQTRLQDASTSSDEVVEHPQPGTGDNQLELEKSCRKRKRRSDTRLKARKQQSSLESVRGSLYSNKLKLRSMRPCQGQLAQSNTHGESNDTEPLGRLKKLRKGRGEGRLKKFLKKRNAKVLDGAPQEDQTQANLAAGENNALPNELTTAPLPKAKRVRKAKGKDVIQKVVTPSASHRNPSTILSWMIDNKGLLPRAKVYYRNGKDCPSLKQGRISRNGIKCSCCHNMFALSEFEVHAGSTCKRPITNIFLVDGESLLDRQIQVLRDLMPKISTKESGGRNEFSWFNEDNDGCCSVCNYGGSLLCCERCPAAFHRQCIGIKGTPKGTWICPSCCCGICEKGNFSEDDGNTEEESVLSCFQCEFPFHIGCLRNKGSTRLERDPVGNWFCSDKCEEIFKGLQKLLGKKICVGEDNLTWTMVKCIKSDRFDIDPNDIDEFTENYSKLHVALGVLRECFEIPPDPETNADLLHNLIYCKKSILKRLNFEGFYTILLERDDELITVANLRVYGRKVAEVPFIGTREQYRNRGMCRVLMIELEKRLKDLGVEVLVLPSIQSMLKTWTRSFQFRKVTNTKRLKWVKYAFFDFQATTLCQKDNQTQHPECSAADAHLKRAREDEAHFFPKCYKRRKTSAGEEA
ncbi:hypothetical protein UlMin_013158 [Ulmus minor]